MSIKQTNFPSKHLLVYLFCLPGDLICWVLVLVIWGLFGDKLVWQNGLWVGVSKDSFWCKKAGNITGGTMGHGGWYQLDLMGDDGIDTKLEYHEHVHVEQYEVVMFFVFVVLFGFVLNSVIRKQFSEIYLLVLAYWALGGLLGSVSGWVIAILRGEEAYRGSHHEEAAYAIEKGFRRS
jgi:hypothetical protein